MRIIETAEEMRAWSQARRNEGHYIGFVPTMGALHEGHASLMRACVQQNDVSVLSVFVNPTQFAPHEDLDRYPRTFEADCALAADIGIDAVYAPNAKRMYPPGYATYVEVERLTEHLCGVSRPTHFRGVTTVVTKLFNAVCPHRAYFGQKDAQQAAVIRRMTRDLDFGIEIVVLPIVREADGLAMSSRNVYLSPEDRKKALGISRGLFAAKQLFEQGERNPDRLVEAVKENLSDVKVDYVSLVDADEIAPVTEIRGRVLLAVAAYVGQTRLIDNILLDADSGVAQ